MQITIDDLRAFLAIVRVGSFAGAADELCITPPALSRRIKKLESIVGERLFERTTHMIALTSIGQALLDRGKSTLREFDDFHQFAKSLAHDSQIKIELASVWSAAWGILPTLIREYTDLHPNAEFVVRDANGTDVIDLVKEREVDFGITTRIDEEDNLEFYPMCMDPIVLACPPQHALYDESSVSWQQLINYDSRRIDWLLFQIASFGSLADKVAEANIRIPTDIKVQHLSTQIGFLESGVRAAVVPALGASLCREGSVRMIPIVDPPLDREMGLIKRRTGGLSNSSYAFFQYIQVNFVERYEARVNQPHWKK